MLVAQLRADTAIPLVWEQGERSASSSKIRGNLRKSARQVSSVATLLGTVASLKCHPVTRLVWEFHISLLPRAHPGEHIQQLFLPTFKKTKQPKQVLSKSSGGMLQDRGVLVDWHNIFFGFLQDDADVKLKFHPSQQNS